MSTRARLAAAASLAAVLGVVTFALAQPPRGGTPPPAPSGPSLNPYGSTAPSATSAPPPAPSTGPVAPPSDLTDGGTKLSPLNPAPNEMPDGGPPPQSIDYDRLLGDVAALRARVAAVSDTLFKSRLAVTMETNGDHARIAALSVALDDGVVFTAPQNFQADDATVVYDHAVAPGRHAVTVEVERRDDRGDTFRSQQRSRFIVDVPRDQKLELDVEIWDDSTMGSDWNDDQSGRYDLRIRAKAKVAK